MTLIETLIIEQGEELFKELASLLPFKEIQREGFAIYRWEVDPDTVILIYHLNQSSKIKAAVLENILPFIKAAMIIAESEAFDGWEYPDYLQDKIEKIEAAESFVIALRAPEGEQEKAEWEEKKNYYLGHNARLLFWNNEKESKINIWKWLWVKLFQLEEEDSPKAVDTETS